MQNNAMVTIKFDFGQGNLFPRTGGTSVLALCYVLCCVSVLGLNIGAWLDTAADTGKLLPAGSLRRRNMTCRVKI